MKYKILVTGTSSYGIGEGMLKVINESNYLDKIELIGASNSQLTAYKNIIENYFILPNANECHYYQEVKKIVRKEKINILIPGAEAEIYFFSKNKEKIEKELNIDIWVNKYQTIKTFNNKLFTKRFFLNTEIHTPKHYLGLKNDTKFPLIIKPIEGKASEGIFIVKNKKEFYAICNFYETIGKGFLIEEFIEKDAEYTVSLINLDGELEILCMQRVLSKGATQYAKIVEKPKIISITQKIHQVLKDELILNLQILEKNNRFYIFEINPRFSGSAPIRSKLGYNEFDIIFSHKYLKKKHQYTLKKDFYCIRGYKEFIYNDPF